MENNILQTLTSMLGTNNNTTQNNTKPQNIPPLYPVEAYPANSQSNNFDSQPQQNNQNMNFGGNNILPLLLSMMGNKGENKDLDMLSTLLSTQNNGGNDANNLFSLFSSLNKKKKEDKNEEISQEEVIVTQGELPKNEIL